MNLCHRLTGRKFRLQDTSAGFHNGFERPDAEAKTAELGTELAELLDMLFAAGRHALLVVFQARDTGGKDGCIRHVLKFCNAQSCRVVPFKVPTPEERAHDFLWRVHSRVPGVGEIALFNRSHYEDVLVAKVHRLADEAQIEKRYDHINAFERLLADSGVILVKFMLHISRDEQERRLLDREKDDTKSWKLNVGDWQEREHWDAYTESYNAALTRCSSERRPWYVVPADHKWFRDLAVTECLVETLRPYRKEWMESLAALGVQQRAELERYRAGLVESP
jgi:PPK2 family polyphosphate:nucleotide phosphotransferase